MSRKLFTLGSVVSLALSVGTAVLWVRGYGRFDSFFVFRGSRGWFLDSHAGSLSVVTLWSRYPLCPGWRVEHLADPAIAYEDLPPRWRMAGFKWRRIRFVLEPGDTMPSHVFNVYTAPCWSPTLVSLVALLLTTRVILRSRTLRANQCKSCGYDLRATPDRCPECGYVPEKLTA